jgi:hypothetical protein
MRSEAAPSPPRPTDGHWRTSFYVTGLAHSILGESWEPTVWRAVQQAGWDAMQHAE